MSRLPYEAATSGSKAIEEARKVLTRFGCERFGHMIDHPAGELIVQFSYRGRDVSIRASFRGYAAAYLKEHPYSYRMRRTREQHQTLASRQAEISVCSVVRDWIKGQVTAIETGILTFEGAFLGQLMLPNGRTVLEVAREQYPAIEHRAA